MTFPEWFDLFRRGYVPSLQTVGLEALLKALTENDPELNHAACGVIPPAWPHCMDRDVAFADFVGFAIWKSEPPLRTVCDVWLVWKCAFDEAEETLGSELNREFWRFYDREPRDRWRAGMLESLGELVKTRKAMDYSMSFKGIVGRSQYSDNPLDSVKYTGYTRTS